MSRFVAVSLLCLLTALPAVAQDETYYVLQHPLKTGFFTNRFTGNGFGAANHELAQLFESATRSIRKEVVAWGGEVVALNTTELGISEEDKLEATASGWAVRDGKHTLYRRKGVVTVLLVGAEPLPAEGAIAKAKTIETEKPLGKVYFQTRRAGSRSTTPYLAEVPATLDELRQIQKAPAGVKHTGFGALLRRAWKKALRGAKDDIEAIDPILTLNFAGLNLEPSGFTTSIRSEEELSVDQANMVLGRKKTVWERWDSFLGRYQPPAEVADETLDLLEESLRRRRSDGDWDQARRLRAKSPGELTSDDLDRLRTLTGRVDALGAAERIPGGR